MSHDDNKSGCLRCGRCCYYIIYDNLIPKLKKCKHLVRFKNGKTLCREYHKALSDRTKHGFKIDSYEFNGETKNVFCVWRKDGHWNYTDCPFNIECHPIFEQHVMQLGLTDKELTKIKQIK